ncbi:hypothetical protein DW979_01105 [Eubacterium sp. AM49-13BH]|nr:hypothetical protein DW979_01105 [Eubacterium sp. AM49-13BH]
MFNIFKKVKNEGNIRSKIIICHMIILLFQRYIRGDSDDEDVDISSDMITDDNSNKTHVTYDSVAVPEVHFKKKK